MSAVPQSLYAPAARGAADERLLAALTRRFAATAADYDASGAFPRDNFDELQRHGLIARAAPAAWGGGGATLA
ncbi:MAG: acyl-CoA dehydrogenase family protein, partial [Xenophilus sp.]